MATYGRMFHPMKKKIYSVSFVLSFLMAASFPVSAENISLKFSFNTNSFSESDINTWLSSYNALWKDYLAQRGGSLSGNFEPPHYGSNFEIELRIPVIAGFALNLAGGPLSGKKEGTVSYQNNDGSQTESHFIRNEVSVFPLKIGFSFSYPLPFLEELFVFAGTGRHIIFCKYNVQENYDALFSVFGKEFSYWYKKEDSYRSEALGYYFTLGAEYTFFKVIAIVLEAEKTWSKADGFKGPFSYKDYSGKDESGKASLYFYESSQFGLSQSYAVLAGHEKRPEGTSVQNLRQGEFNFSNFSIKIGFRLKF